MNSGFFFDLDLLLNPVAVACAAALFLAMAALLIARRKRLSGAQKALCAFGLVLSLVYLLFVLYLVLGFNSSRPDPQPAAFARAVLPGHLPL